MEKQRSPEKICFRGEYGEYPVIRISYTQNEHRSQEAELSLWEQEFERLQTSPGMP